MIRTQVQLEDDQYEQIRRLAESSRVSIAQTVRQLLRQGLRLVGGEEALKTTHAREVLKIAGIGRSEVGEQGQRQVQSVPAPLPLLRDPVPVAGIDLDDTSRLWELE